MRSATPCAPRLPRQLAGAAALVTALALSGAVLAQGGPPPAAKTECMPQPPRTAETPPTPGPGSGTAPGNSGSTGWTGGMGGSTTGTSPHAPTPGSETQHPATAQGLDPKRDTPQERC